MTDGYAYYDGELLLLRSDSNEDEVIDCNALATTLSEHSYLDDLDSFMTTMEYPETYLTNCNAYYDELQSLVDKGCYDILGWTADSITAMRNEMCDTTSTEVETIIGTWTLSAVCTFADTTDCTGECTDVTAEYIDVEGSFSMTFSEDGTGTFTSSEGSDSFNWFGSGSYTITFDDEIHTVNLAEGSITWNSFDDVCIQFTLTK